MGWNAWVAAVFLTLTFPATLPAAGSMTPDRDRESTYEKGRKEAVRKNWEKAADLFRKAIAENPKNHKAHNMYGYVLRNLGRYKESLLAYDAALSLKPDFAQALEYRAMAHLLSGNRDAAMKDYKALVRLGSPLAEPLKKKMDLHAAGKLKAGDSNRSSATSW